MEETVFGRAYADLLEQAPSRSWQSQSGRLVVVSNRVAPIEEGQPTAGGLAAGVTSHVAMLQDGTLRSATENGES